LAQHPIEIILLRQWASYLAVPIWIVDTQGNLVYCNEPAESLSGVRFDGAGDVPVETHAARFDVTDSDGRPMMSEDLPIALALAKQTPAHRAMRIRDMVGNWRSIEVSSFPILGVGGRQLGAVALFWEVDG
jgi:PAS domain S-box-containing protein